jgi:DNA polymerase elongation subunit (family B)
VATKGYENALLLVTNAIDKIMTGEDIEQQDLVISKLLRQDINRYRSLFPHVSAAIQLTINNSEKSPMKGDTIQYIYTNSQHTNPLCRVVPLESIQKQEQGEEGMKKSSLDYYDKEKYREMVLDAADTVLGSFGFDIAVYGNFKKKKGRKWYEDLRDERTKDIETEMMER